MDTGHHLPISNNKNIKETLYRHINELARFIC